MRFPSQGIKRKIIWLNNIYKMEIVNWDIDGRNSTRGFEQKHNYECNDKYCENAILGSFVQSSFRSKKRKRSKLWTNSFLRVNSCRLISWWNKFSQYYWKNSSMQLLPFSEGQESSVRIKLGTNLLKISQPVEIYRLKRWCLRTGL